MGLMVPDSRLLRHFDGQADKAGEVGKAVLV
jgi:hypothetical protein